MSLESEKEKALDKAYTTLRDHFTAAQILAIGKAVMYLIEAYEISKSDARIFEGDDEREIRGY